MVFGAIAHQCLTYRSRVADRTLNEGADITCFVDPVRAFIVLAAFPPLCVPLGVLYGIATCRMAATARLPYRNQEPMYTDQVEYCVFRRVYDPAQRRLMDDMVGFDPDTLEYALNVVGKKRRLYVDDPFQKGVAYMVVERYQMNRAYVLRGTFWMTGFLTDFVRTVVPLMLCLSFWPSSKRLATDIVLVAQGKLIVANVRHPISNFFLTANEYSKVRNRYVTTLPAKVKPMNLKL